MTTHSERMCLSMQMIQESSTTHTTGQKRAGKRSISLVLTKEADAGPCIKPVAHLLGLDFIPICSERFDLLINKDRFFDQGIQLFLSLLKGKVIQATAEEFGGYDLSMTGKMIYPEPEPE